MIVINARFLTQEITGVQRFAIEISLRLKELLGDEVVFFTPPNIIQIEYAQRLDAKVIGVHKGHVWEQWDLPNFLNKNGSPLLLCLCNTAPLYYKNKIITIHDVAFKAYPQTFSKAFLYYYKFIIPRIIKSALKIITVSQFSKDEIIKYYGTEERKIKVVYPAVANNFHIEEDTNLKKEKYLLAVSSLNYRKNFISILKAFDIFEKKRLDISLYIIGDLSNGSFKNIDISKYKSNPRIKFLGRVSDEQLVKYYSNALAFVFTSIYEGFGIPPLEAQACGCPILVSSIPPLHEIIGNSGMFCDPYNSHNIANCMSEILNNPNGLEKKGFENAKRFSFTISTKQVYNIIIQYLNI